MIIRSEVDLDTDTPALRGQVCIPAGQLCTAFCVNCPTCMWALQLNTDLVYLIETLAESYLDSSTVVSQVFVVALNMTL